MITGTTKLIAHLGYPTESFKAPLIYNPYFEKNGIDAVVVPMGCRPEDYPAFLKLVFRLSNIHGALITMPHKIATMALLDEASTNAKVAGSCNAVRLDPNGRLIGDMFDGEGFVRGVLRKGKKVEGANALVVGAGGVGSAIAASLAKAGVAHLAIVDANEATAAALLDRLKTYYPHLHVTIGSLDPTGFDIVVNATPLGMRRGDPLPIDVDRISPSTFVGEVVLSKEITPFLEAARARGCTFQVGTDMLFEQIPAYLEFFEFPTTTADNLRAIAKLG
ncbi:shikimate dehydrogenase [Rhizobium redzepovicii]|uniref:Shikimate dehydrogenase n=1 Tax=Rhizobium redzepovicii TaxID=2867518 RepID=A0AAW8P3I9_9HYPH|nr:MULTISPECIES: shikimate dehydrogenase [Rhizobium]MBB3524136.1 shikimate dehydrogenase [Rhizobium sp. BK456]MBY4590653.1 shikimate dehydrogenase [Rhizobium redzepovicii]MBY4612382.1 shikimate dehydrogenase [Rhizobium redzepovicii]MDR9761116.1 shikimate dehydrogenase [Rhizobium redzepovicii]MDR9782877.1 shikimate dehydrogenase [Rhizobium redzepovicii]